jgi:hypothetical protein
MSRHLVWLFPGQGNLLDIDLCDPYTGEHMYKRVIQGMIQRTTSQRVGVASYDVRSSM